MARTPISVRLAKSGRLPSLDLPTKLPVFGLEANCRNKDTNLFFSEVSSEVLAAKAICVECPILSECARWGVQFAEYGVFGGLSEKERFLIRGGRPVISLQDLENIRQESDFILNSSSAKVALRFGVDKRTIVRWRGILRSRLEVA
jgi:hypothetical protein